MSNYADFEYYKAEYGGLIFESVDTFRAFARKASLQIDNFTNNRLTKGMPDDENIVARIKDCTCEIAEFMKSVSDYQNASSNVLKGQNIKSVTSGTESVTYSTPSDASSGIIEAVKSPKAYTLQIYGIIRVHLAGVPDKDGINLLYSGI